MKNHLMSIFPTPDSSSYARVSILAIDETSVPLSVPFLVCRSELAALLNQTSLEGHGQQQLADLDRGTAVQVQIDEGDAISFVYQVQGMDQRRFSA